MQRSRRSYWLGLHLVGLALLVAYLAFTCNTYIMRRRPDVGSVILAGFTLNSSSSQQESGSEEHALPGHSQMRRALPVNSTKETLHAKATHAKATHAKAIHSTGKLNATSSTIQDLSGNSTPSDSRNRAPESGANFFTIIPDEEEARDYPDLTRFEVPRLSHPNLPRLLNVSEYRELRALMAELDDIFTHNNITYILAYGSLLGSYLFHDILPWDDDLDLLVKVSDRQKMLDLFTRRQYDHIGAIEHKNHASKMIKLFYKNSQRAGNYDWKWPFADAAFYDESEDSVWSTQKGVIRMKRPKFYPLHRRPYGGLWLPAPHDPRTFLRFKYHSFLCKSHYWNHRREISAKPRSTNCSRLLDFYPMVHRAPEGDGVRETLTLGNKTLYSVHIDEPYWNQVKPYVLK